MDTMQPIKPSDTNTDALAMLSERLQPLGVAIFDGKLTKTALFQLHEGSYIVSTCLYDIDTPMICQPVAADAVEREALWKKIRALKLPGTLFRAFKRLSDCQAWLLRTRRSAGVVAAAKSAIAIRSGERRSSATIWRGMCPQHKPPLRATRG